MQTMFIVTEMTFKDHSRWSTVLSFVRSPGLNQQSEKLATLQTKIAIMTLKVDEGHLW